MACEIELPFTGPYLWVDSERVCHLMGDKY